MAGVNSGGAQGVSGPQAHNININKNEKSSAADFLLHRNAAEINGAAMDAGEKVPLDALMLAIMTERAELLESQLREQVDSIRKKNSDLKEANNVMAKARNAKKDSTDSKKTAMPGDVKNFFKEKNIPWGDTEEFKKQKEEARKKAEAEGSSGDSNTNDDINSDNNEKIQEKLKATQWDLAIENLKGWTEGLTSTSQLEMTKLQSTSGKFNQTFEMLSQFISKYYRGGDSIIKNI